MTVNREDSNRSSIRTIAVIGCGLMGCGIAEVAALAGFDVLAIKATAGDAAPVRVKIEKSLERAVTNGKLTAEKRDAALAHIKVSSDLGDAAEADLVIESAVESAIAKKRLLSELESIVREDAIIASNTSSLRLSELAEALRDPTRFLAMHFFSPVPAMKLVEVAGTDRTARAVCHTAVEFAQSLGKTPVVVSPTPGYVVNRLLVPLLLHAIESLESGVASANEIDTAMKLGCGHPMGPLALCDLIGLDVVLAMAKTLSVELNDPRYRAPSLLRRLVLEGHLGRKSKLGFYDYSSKEPVPNGAITLGIGRAIASVA
jgi:3-hydroxybutyryl-CoA dehydrogenase